jgi:flagellar hook-associated protein 3 FlgL
MRISTSAMHYNALRNMLSQQATLSKTQNEIALGRRVNSPADDPVASVHIMELQRALQESEQYGANSNMATNRLTLEEQALQDIGTLLQGVSERAVQGNNDSVDANSRKMIATELRGRLAEMMDIANRRDANGEYLFSGYSTSAQPFVRSGASVTYLGDQNSRQLQIGPNQKVADSHSGFELFVDVPEGNGTFVTDAGTTNAGNAIIANGSVTDLSQWAPDDYTIRFLDAAGNYEILDSGGVQVTTGTYTANNAISFNGVSINMTGTPAMNDTFTVSRSRSEDVFTTMSKLITTLESNPMTDAQRAQFHTDMASAIQQLQQSSDHLLGVRAEVGTRLSTLENAANAREDRDVELKSMTSELRDLDYAEAITRMNQQLMGLEAAQASYSRISQLSLFDYLR